MAKKRKMKSRSSRGRRVGGLVPKRYQQDTMLTAGVVAGMLLARTIPAMINKVVPGIDAKVVNGIQTIGGVVIGVMSSKYPLMRGAGIGIGAMGGIDFLTNMNILPSSDAVSGDEVVLSLDNPVGGYGSGYPSNFVAGSVGASFNNQNYANNLIAGDNFAAYGMYV
jgi:hypothetical protein